MSFANIPLTYMTKTVFRVKFLDSFRGLAGGKVIALGCGPNFSVSEIERAISGMHLWLNEALLEDFKTEDSELLGDVKESFLYRLKRFSELAVKRNRAEENTLTQEELVEAAQILISLHEDYYKSIPDYRELTDIILKKPVE